MVFTMQRCSFTQRCDLYVWKCLPVPVFQVMAASTFESSLPRESGWSLVKTSAKSKPLRLKPRTNRLELTPANIKLHPVFFLKCTHIFFKTYGTIKYHYNFLGATLFPAILLKIVREKQSARY